MSQSEKGFTLLELIVSLAIMGLMAAVVFGALSLGIRSWERGNRLTESAQNHMFNWELVSRQIRSAYPFRGRDNNLYFKGEKGQLAFISAYSLRRGDRNGLVRVIYKVVPEQSGDGTSFLVYEEPLLDKERLEQKVDQDDFLELMTSPGKVSFSYQKKSVTVRTEDKEADWGDKWDTREQGLPAKVKIAFHPKGSGQKEQEQVLLLPIMVQEERRI